MITLKPTKIVRQFLKRLGPDLDLLLKIPGVTIFTIALNGFDPSEISELVGFIDELLDVKCTDKELVDYWWSLPTYLALYSGADVRIFLAEIRDVASKPPYTPRRGSA